MSIFEKLGLKKKEEPIQTPAPRGDMPPMRAPSMPDLSTPEMPEEIQRPSFAPPRIKEESRGTDLINAKLDAIKAILDNINARIERLEKIASQEEETPRWR